MEQFVQVRRYLRKTFILENLSSAGIYGSFIFKTDKGNHHAYDIHTCSDDKINVGSMYCYVFSIFTKIDHFICFTTHLIDFQLQSRATKMGVGLTKPVVSIV